MQTWFPKVMPAVAAVLATALLTGALYAQGVTTGAASGLITDQNGNPMSGATVELTHEPTGFRTTAVTNVRGIFTLQGLEPGGPYTVRIRQIGYRPITQERIFIALGQTFRLNASLEVIAVELEEIMVVADPMAAEFAPTRQGTRTTITGEQLADLPTLDRRFIDFARLTPQIVNRDENQGLGVSAMGQNNRFNTIQIDGSTVNDRFGLGSTGTSGGQARGKPIGFEAVKEYQVELAPYDVRQGNFTGALINAITKNGTNRWQASAFGYFRNQNFAGSPLGDTEFETWQFGATLGGPIKKDEAHFFLDAEFQRASTPAPGPATGGAGVVPDQADVDAFNAALVSKGLTPGSAGLFTQDNPLTNLTARADWLLSTNNRLVFRYTYNEAGDDVFNQWESRDGAFRLDNNAYRFNNKTHNPSLQLFSNFTNGSSNEFRLSFNRIRDTRDPAVIEPQVTVGGFTNSAGDGYALRAGAESFSMGNALDQDIWELTDNFTLKPMGDHRITIGTRNEFYKVNNLFAQQSFGVWQYDDLASFVAGQAGDANQYDVGGDLGGGIPAVFNSAIIGLYVQDQWQITPKFNLTYGLRVDIPIFPDQPTYAAQAIADFDDPQVPSSQALWNPRAGFNWDMDGLGNQQLRGGAGIFTGTPAYVWMSNAYANNGTGLGLLECDNGPNTVTPTFNASATSPTLACDGPGGAGTGTGVGDGTFLGQVDIIAGNTKFPQVFRGNLAYDRRLPEDFILTLEGIFSTGVNDYFIVNRNLSAPCSTTGGVCGNSKPADDVGDGIVGSDENGRIMYGGIDPTNGTALRRTFRQDVYGDGSQGVFELRNTSENYAWNVSVSLRKQFGRNFNMTGSYTYGQSKDVQSFGSSRATSNWRRGRVNSGDQFSQGATISSFDRPNKVAISGTYVFPWERWSTQISLIYIGQSGQPYTYVAGAPPGGSSRAGDLNADGTNENDPIYLMRSTADQGISFVNQADADAFSQWIAGESCLDSQRGTIMRRNTCRNPWQNFLDANIRQALPAWGNNIVTLELGIYNLLNLFDSDWGQVKTVGGTEDFTDDILHVVGADAQGRPLFAFNQPTERFESNGSILNSWQVQLSARWEYGQTGIF